MANALHLATLVGETFTADDFAAVIAQTLNVPGQVVVTPVTNETWLADTGQPWDSGGLATPLTYAVSAVDDDTQVVTFQITGGSPPQSTTIYGEVMNWNGKTILFQGFTSDVGGVLSNPLQGPSQFFILSSASLAASGGRPQNNMLSVGSNPPFGLRVFNNAACFARGTAIQTPSGPVAVEDLAEGDAVLTASGQTQPIQWIGRSNHRVDRHLNPGRIAPVRIKQHAFGGGLPVRDLVLSPEHAIYHDGVLIPVHCLVNGTTIRQDAVASASYFHIELAHHDVLLAEGLAAESYLDTGNRDLMMRAVRAKAHAA